MRLRSKDNCEDRKGNKPKNNDTKDDAIDR
jgi:hypothetical protein